MKKFNLLFLFVILMMNLTGQQWPPDEAWIGTTYYDLQNWRAMQNRIFVYEDGTIGAVWDMGFNYPGFNDLGIGYNYFDGNNWGEVPYQSITSGWAINPSYTAYGENGELCVSQGQNGLFINWRVNKGTGSWQQTIFTGTNLKQPVVITTGANHSIVHLLYLSADPTFEPTNAQPARGFIYYARSTDGMQTWDINQEVPGLGPDQYLGFTIGAYAWAEPKGDVLAFVGGDYLTDLVLMKSFDGGDSWQKTIVWHHPYPMFEIFTFISDTFYCNDGGITVALDNAGMAHVAFGLSRVYSTVLQDTLWYDPATGGIAYWQEDMPAFKNTLNALNPDSLSICDNLVAWPLDLNGNGTIDTIPFTVYPTPGMLTMPNLVINDNGQMFLTFSGVTETYTNGIENYRHLWLRSGSVYDCTWGNFMDLTSDLIHIFDECVYPNVAAYVDDYLHLIYLLDNEPGLSLPYPNLPSENYIKYMKISLWWADQKSEKGTYADFRIKPDSIFAGDTVHFQNLSCGCPYPVSYTWEFEGGEPATSALSDPDIVYNTPGTFDVGLTVSNGLTTSAEFKPDYIKVYNYTDVKESFENFTVDLSPNSNNGQFSLKFNGIGESKIEIGVFDILGQKVLLNKGLEIKNKQLTLDLTNQQEGIYFLVLKYSSTLITRKLVVRY